MRFLSFIICLFLIGSTATAKPCSVCTEKTVSKTEAPPCHDSEEKNESEETEEGCCPLCVMTSLDKIELPTQVLVLNEYKLEYQEYYNSYKSLKNKPHLPPPKSHS